MTPELNNLPPLNRPDDPNEYIDRILTVCNDRTITIHEAQGRVRELVYMIYLHGMEDGVDIYEARMKANAEAEAMKPHRL